MDRHLALLVRIRRKLSIVRPKHVPYACTSASYEDRLPETSAFVGAVTKAKMLENLSELKVWTRVEFTAALVHLSIMKHVDSGEVSDVGRSSGPEQHY